MIVPLSKQSRVYIAAPANLATGGPELLHQLAHKLRLRGISACMYYLPANHPGPVHSSYQAYGVSYAREIEDNKDNLLVVPETMTNLLDGFKEIRKAIWWLSIDNYFVEQETRYGKINRYLLSKFGSQRYVGFNRELRSIDYHFYQSEYAKHALLKLGIKSLAPLSDYLNRDFLQIETDLSEKENIVAFNPKKGRRFTKKIIKQATDIKFVPIVDMTRAEVVALLQKAKVYIDFGHHPGKDRIPREACVLGCCVITSKKGSAKYHEDVPIKDRYKFRDTRINARAIAERIRDCFVNFEECSKDFSSYRAIINAQEEVFDQEIDKLFVLQS
jgi:hypothetical protein